MYDKFVMEDQHLVEVQNGVIDVDLYIKLKIFQSLFFFFFWFMFFVYALTTLLFMRCQIIFIKSKFLCVY